MIILLFALNYYYRVILLEMAFDCHVLLCLQCLLCIKWFVTWLCLPSRSPRGSRHTHTHTNTAENVNALLFKWILCYLFGVAFYIMFPYCSHFCWEKNFLRRTVCRHNDSVCMGTYCARRETAGNNRSHWSRSEIKWWMPCLNIDLRVGSNLRENCWRDGGLFLLVVLSYFLYLSYHTRPQYLIYPFKNLYYSNISIIFYREKKAQPENSPNIQSNMPRIRIVCLLWCQVTCQ